MSVLYLFFGIIMTLFWGLVRQRIGDKRFLVVLIFLVALLCNALFPNTKAINILVSILKVSALSLIISEALFGKYLFSSGKKNSSPEAMRKKRKIIFLAAGLMVLISIHNLLDISFLFDESKRKTVSALNPWGLFSTVLIISSSLALSLIRRYCDIVNSSIFRFCIFTFSIAFSGILALVFLNYLPGNTDKVALSIGGVGLGNMSTNDTSLLACSLLLWVLQIQKLRGVSFLSLASIGCLIGMVLFTQSRLGISCIFIIFFLYLYYKGKYRTREIIVTALIILVFSIPAIKVMAERMNEDVDIGSGVGDNVMIGSGRGFIWLSYLDAFSDVASEKPLTWVFGVGPDELVKLYDNTFLSELGLDVAEGSYFPLHSDVVFTFLTTGILGLILWVSILLSLCFQVKRNGFDFCSVSAIVIFILYSFFDMLIYSPYSVWLLALAMINRTGNLYASPSGASIVNN